MPTEQVLNELNFYFNEFDKIIEKHKVEKLKTIGDGYMAALEIRDFIKKTKKARIINKLPYWDIRIGIHTGPLIAGIIDQDKFSYDV